MATIKIHAARYRHNLDLLSSRLGGHEKLCVVLKDNAYGHGLRTCAQLASDAGVSLAMVRTIQEAQAIQGLFGHILILFHEATPPPDPAFGYVINDHEEIAYFSAGTQVHLKVDTGMHRNGIAPDRLEASLQRIQKAGLRLYGVMTHFRSADELGSDLFWQMRTWEGIKERVRSFCHYAQMPLPRFHSGNSATVLRLHHYPDDFARCGIATYGYASMDPLFGKFDLRPVLSLYAHRLSTRRLPEGARIGYGGVGRLEKAGSVSTYDIGYGDGLLRYDGKGTLRSAEGYRILGRVSMDALSIEGEAKEVCIFEDAQEFAKQCNTIVYDLLVKLSPDIERVVL